MKTNLQEAKSKPNMYQQVKCYTNMYLVTLTVSQ